MAIEISRLHLQYLHFRQHEHAEQKSADVFILLKKRITLAIHSDHMDNVLYLQAEASRARQASGPGVGQSSWPFSYQNLPIIRIGTGSEAWE